MGWDPEIQAKMQDAINQLRLDVDALKGNPQAQLQKAVDFENTKPVEIIGDSIQNAYDVINTQIADLQQNKTAESNSSVQEKINNLISLKSEVPFHFSFGQKDQVWINDQINSILGGQTSVVIPK